MKISMKEGHFTGMTGFYEDQENRGPIAFVAVMSEEVKGHVGLGIAVANERGYAPVPAWYAIFEEYEDADDEADRLNDKLGLDPKEAFKIVASTMDGQLYRAAS